MKIIKDISKDIECALDKAEDSAKKAILLKTDFPSVSQRYWNNINVYLDITKGLHDEVVAIINNYRREKGEPPAPMMAIYDYLHERFMEKTAAVKQLQELYKTGA